MLLYVCVCMQARVKILENSACGSSAPGPYSASKVALVDGQPIVMMQYMRPDASNVASIQTMHNGSPSPTRDRSVDGQWRPSFRSVDCDSSLSSIGGDLHVLPVGAASSTQGSTDPKYQSHADEPHTDKRRVQQAEVAWQGNPEYSGQGEEMPQVAQR